MTPRPALPSSVTDRRNAKPFLVPAGILGTKASRRLVDSGLSWDEIGAIADGLGLVMCWDCDEPFAPRRADARYCSNACRQKAHRQRKAGRL